MRASITGASGLLGGNLALLLRTAGHEVRATRRGSTKVAHLEGKGIEWVPADLDDVGALTEAFRGVDVVYHCAAQVSILRKPTPGLVRANVDGTRNVIEAVREARVARLVHCSTVGAVGLSENGAPTDERATWNFDRHGLADGYVTTKRQAEDLVRAAVREGLDAVIANPTYMLGPYDARPSSGKLILDVVRGKLPGRSPGMNNFVDVRDVARGMMLVAEKGAAGERYILGGVNLSYAEAIDVIARVAGAPPVRRNVPRVLAAPIGWLGDLRERFGGEPLINSVTVRYAYCPSFIFSSAKAERDLGYSHGPIEDAVRDAIAWFREAGMI
jgi:dihydroflavonol-4-reductase